ncbi:MAG: DUF6457 domain-containing protein [Micrococcales bacterium]|nr:DUF6457 domain-containing protein [Micrococcales bacterium]
MSDLHETEARWHAWVSEVCAELGVDPALVDIELIHRLTKEVAHRGERPMAPVSAYILGMAVGQGGGAPAALSEQIIARLPAAQE